MIRHCLIAIVVALAVSSPLVRAQSAAAEGEKPKQYLGKINANAVYVRSGPSENNYQTQRLDKGTEVTVVDIKFDWLKVVPPEGSFSCVSKLYVEKHGDGTVGKVTKDNLSVWAGSALTTVKSELQCRLARGTDVQILGDIDEYYKIKPPADAYLWVHKNFVSPVLADNGQPKQAAGTATVAGAGTGAGTGSTPAGGAEGTTDPSATQPAITGSGPADTQPVTLNQDPVTPPTTQAAGSTASAEAEFDKLEAQFKETATQDIEQQPIEEMQAGYEKLVKSDALSTLMHQIAENRLNVLNGRAKAKQQVLANKEAEAAAAKRLQALRAEREELQARMEQLGVAIYTAVGELQTSSLQVGSTTLYRLTDPANGRTVCYVRGTDPKLGGMIGQFVGVKGEVASDPDLSLRVVKVTEAAAVDPAKVNRGVAAQIIPPSILAAVREVPATQP